MCADVARRKSDQVYPNFLYIGAAKAGSTWLFEVLREHPQVFVPVAKDLQFFDYHYDLGIDWYLSHFKEGRNKIAVGEISHDYFLSEESAQRISKWLPHVRLICCLREPVDRTISSFVYHQRTMLKKTISFEEFAFSPEVLKLGDYYNNLQPFFHLFPRTQILVLFYDELKQDARNFLKNVYTFFGVDPNFIPKGLNQRFLPARVPRNYFLAHLAYQAGQALRNIGYPNILGRAKRNTFLEALFYKKVDQKPIPPEEARKRLQEYFSKDYANLSKLIGQKIPPSWFK